MTSRFRDMIPHALVMAIDAIWGWTLSAFGRPLLIELLDHRQWKAVEVLDGLIVPRLWVSYVVVLSAQLVWVMLVSPRELQSRRLQQLWWLGCGISLASALTVQVQLTAWFCRDPSAGGAADGCQLALLALHHASHPIRQACGRDPWLQIRRHLSGVYGNGRNSRSPRPTPLPISSAMKKACHTQGRPCWGAPMEAAPFPWGVD